MLSITGALHPASVSGQADPQSGLEPDGNESSGDHEAFFYAGADYGSEASFGPLSFILNRGLHLARAKTGSADIRDVPDGWHTFSTALRRPVWAVQRAGGFRHWASTQLVPFRWDKGGSWAVNYTGHLIEAGVGLRTITERLEAAGVPHARLWAHLTVFGSSLLAELYEASQRQEAFSSHVADFYIFEPAGHLLFSFDRVARLFGETLGTRIWPHQAGVSLTTGEFMNTGLDMVMKVPFPLVNNLSIFARMGMGSDVGVTLHRPNGWDFSLAAGFAATDPTTDPITGDELIDAVASASFYIDRNESLVASIHGNYGRGRRLTVNLYPGSLGFLTPDLGLWVVVDKFGALQFGFSHRSWMGLGPAR